MHEARVQRKLEDLALCHSLPAEDRDRLIADFRAEMAYLTFDDEHRDCMALLSDYAADHPEFMALILLRDREHLTEDDTVVDLDLPKGEEHHGDV